MNNSELSTLLSMVIGDGYITKSDRFEIEHGSKQKDYLEWKHKLLCTLLNINPNISKRTRILNNVECVNYLFGVSLKRQFGLKGLRKEIYGNGKRKNYIKILNKIEDTTFLLAVWFGDDGMIRRRVTNNVTNSAGLDIATFDQTLEEIVEIQNWFKIKLNLNPKIKQMYSSKYNKSWNYLSFSQYESMVIWNRIKNILLSIDSMKHKFRHVDEKFNRSFKYLEYNPSESPQRPTNKKYELSDLACSLEELVQAYKELGSSYKVADKYSISATAVKRMLKEAGVLRTQSEAACERMKI